MVTVAGVVCSLAVPLVVLPRGWWLLAGAALVVVSAVADSADGGVAILNGRTSRLGSFFDSMADRVSEAAWLVALYILGAPGVLVVACGALAWLHEYARARAALSGMPGLGAVTVAERPVRVIIVAIALALGGVLWEVSTRLAPGIITVALGVWLGLGVLGGTRLLGAIHSALR
jgi:CDP-diacylglycerol--glycerol-3-phosphate 3-phosphatidyltransferase